MKRIREWGGGGRGGGQGYGWGGYEERDGRKEDESADEDVEDATRRMARRI